MNTRHERRHDIDGELLPALPEDVRPARAPIVIRLPQASTDEPGLLEHEIRRPARPPSFESDVLVPSVQAAFTAIAAAICAGVLAWALGWHVRAVAVTFGLVLAGAWLWRMRVADGLLWEVERLTGRDVNHDGQIGRPGLPVLVNPWQARQEVTRAQVDEDAQHERQELVAFVHRCYTVGCSEGAHGVKASGPDRETYVKHRDVLLSLGIAQWRNVDRPRAGWRLVVSHQKAMELLSKYTL